MKDREIIFLTGHRKCGTTMFHCLFDGHEELNSYPVDLTMLYAYFPHIINSDASECALKERLATVIFDTLEFELKSHEIDFDLQKFKDIFNDCLSDKNLRNPAAIIDAMLTSWTIHQDLDSSKPFVVKETSADIYAQEILSWFPNTKFIHLVRDPRDNYSALKAGVSKYYSKMGEDELTTLASLLNRAAIDFRMALINPSIIGEENYKVVKFEDVVSDSEGVMRDIADFLDIPFNPTLTQPTFLKHPTYGNNHEGAKMDGVSNKNISKWKQRITENEAMIIEFAFIDLMDKFGYHSEYSHSDSAKAFAEFYKWSNYHYFHHDPFFTK